MGPTNYPTYPKLQGQLSLKKIGLHIRGFAAFPLVDSVYNKAQFKLTTPKENQRQHKDC